MKESSPVRGAGEGHAEEMGRKCMVFRERDRVCGSR